MLDKIKGTIQNQFDQWYVNIHARGGNHGTGVGVGPSKNERNEKNERSDGNENGRIVNGENTYDNNSDDNSNNMRSKNDNCSNNVVDNNHHDIFSHSVRSRSSTINTGRNKTVLTENQNFNSEKSVTDSASTKNSKNNLDVDSDILAFYKAREDLLKLRVANY